MNESWCGREECPACQGYTVGPPGSPDCPFQGGEIIDESDTGIMQVIDQLAAELHKAMGGQPMEEHVETAVEKLNDDDVISFVLVAIKEDEDGYQHTYQRAVDPQKIRDLPHDRDSEEFIDKLHEAMCLVFDEEVRH